MRAGARSARGVRVLRADFFVAGLRIGLVAGMVFRLKDPGGKICGLLPVILNFATQYSPTLPGNIAFCCHAFHCDAAAQYAGSCHIPSGNQD